VKQIDRYYFFDETRVMPKAIMMEVGVFTTDRAAWWRAEYPSSRVWLVEAEPVNFAELAVAADGVLGVHIAQVALAPKDGPVHLYRYQNRHSHSLIPRDTPEARGRVDSIEVTGMTLETLRAELRGSSYWKWHPRVTEHPGAVVVIGCLNWCYAYEQDMKGLGKRVIGIDPQATAPPAGFELISGAVAPYRGTAHLYGHDGGASFFWTHRPVIANVVCITMTDVLIDAGGDLAALQMNCEGMEAFILLTMQRPYADQMTIAFHDRPSPDNPTLPIGQGEPYLPSARDGLIMHLSQWYRCVQITPREDNDWWFFLKRG